jgi:hypothetical protein
LKPVIETDETFLGSRRGKRSRLNRDRRLKP